MKYILFILFVCHSVLAQDATTLEQLTKRIDELERQQDELIFLSHGRSNPVNSFLRNNLTIGGFFETGIIAIEGKDTELQIMNNASILGLNIAADYSSRLRFVSQFLTGIGYPLENEHNNPQGSPDERRFGNPIFGALLTQGYVEYTFSSHFRIQGGVGYVPFGHSFQQRELVLFWRRNGPQMIRTNNLISPLWGGLHVLGNFARKSGGEWGYNVYTANSIDPDENRMLGLGGRLWLSTENDTSVFGISAQTGKYRKSTDEIVGGDYRLQKGVWNLQTEYVRHITDGDDSWSAYIEPGLFIRNETFLLFVFGDYARNSLERLNVSGTEIDNEYEKWEYGAGVNWLPSVYTRLRLSLTRHDYVGETSRIGGHDRDYYAFDISAGVAF